MRSRFAMLAGSIAALIAGVGSSFPARAAAAGCVAAPSGLVSWWPGDTNNNDIAGSNNPNNASSVTLVPAEVSDGFMLGKNGYLEVPASKSLANQKFTWAAWVKPLGAGPNNDSSGDTVVQQDIDDYSLSMAIYWRSMDNRFFFVFGNSATESFASKDTFQTGVFYHVATTYDGSVFRLYVNGVLEGSFNEAKTVTYSSSPWTIGSSGEVGVSVGYPRTLNGIVDEVQAFNRALSQSELQAIYAAGSSGECKSASQQIGTGVITGPGSPNIVNAASFANPALPNALIAQGSLFTIFGSKLGPSVSPPLAFPLPATLGGVSIAVTQGTITVAAIPVYVSPSQLNAIMPSNAPLGTVSVNISYGGQTQSVGSANVVKANFGIFTVNSEGSGPGILTNASYALIGYNSPARPGSDLVIWGTGLGAIPGNDADPPPTGDIGSTPPTIYFGGQQLIPTYYGRSGCCSGLDQIVFQVPSDVTGCNVPVAVQTGSTISNFVSVAVSSSNACSDPSGFSAAQFSALAHGSVSVGSVIYKIYNNLSPGFNLFGGSTEESSGTQELATFDKYQLTNPENFTQVLNSGACTVFTFTGTSFNGSGVLSFAGLDAGSSILASGGGAQGSIKESSTKGVYSALYDLPDGSIQFSGTGGTDVGSFSVTLPVTTQNLQWTNEDSISSITRSNGVTVDWTGGSANGTVQVTGYSIGGSSNSTAAGAGFTCTTSAGPGEFTVPAEILSALPASVNLGNDILSVATGFLGISQNSSPVFFTATGLNLGFAQMTTSITNSTVTYQ